MSEDARTIVEKLRDYNRLATVASGLGLSYRERKSFKDQADATRSLAAVESSIRAAREAQSRMSTLRKREERRMTIGEKKTTPDFASLSDAEELMLAHNGMEAMAAEAGLARFAPRAAPFGSREEGVRVCQETYAAIRQVRDYNEMVLTAIDLGLTYLSRREFFETLEGGVEACAALDADIRSTIERRDSAESKDVAKRTNKTRDETSTNGRAPRGSGTRFPLEATIEWLGRDGENPYNPNKSRHAPVEIVRKAHGRTVKTYLAKEGASGNILALVVRQGYARVNT